MLFTYYIPMEEQFLCVRQLVADVVASMVPEYAAVAKARSHHSATLVRIVNELSLKHEIVFESIVRKLRLGVNSHCDAAHCQQMFAGVVDKLFADGRYNWGRVVTVFAYAGWMARVGNANSLGTTSEFGVVSWSTIVINVASAYVSRKLSHWICQQGGWDAMERFFAKPVPFETKLWQCLLYTFFSLSALATEAGNVR